MTLKQLKPKNWDDLFLEMAKNDELSWETKKSWGYQMTRLIPKKNLLKNLKLLVYVQRILYQ